MSDVTKTPLLFTPSQQENLLQWAAWLDSTTREQGRQALRSQEEKYCCLGIYVAEAYPNKNWKLTDEHTEDARYKIWSGSYWNGEFLTKKMVLELGLNKYIYVGNSNTLQECFTELNDTYNFTFADIAVEVRHLVLHGTFSPKGNEVLDPDNIFVGETENDSTPLDTEETV